MNKYILFLFLLSTNHFHSQNGGHIDIQPKKTNLKTIGKGKSCKIIKPKPILSSILSDSIKETSGLLFFDGLFWTHNDDSDTTLYGLDNSGKIKRKITLQGVENKDWEAIAQDSSYLYIGDFGNNYSGNRKDLRILKIDKTSFLQQQPIIEQISFSYSNQLDYSTQKNNHTDFDCEAFVVIKDSIYLFTKQWNSKATSLYSIPNQSGHHNAHLQATFNTKGLITDATYIASENKIVLCGYTKNGSSFIYLLHDFAENQFFSGCKTRINLKLPFHQIEGITTIDGIHYYLTNESLIRKPIVNIPAKIHILDLSSILKSYKHN